MNEKLSLSLWTAVLICFPRAAYNPTLSISSSNTEIVPLCIALGALPFCSKAIKTNLKYQPLISRLGHASALVFVIAESASILCSEAFLAYAIPPEVENLLSLCVAFSYSSSLICWAIFLQAHSHETASASGPRSFLLAYALFFLYDKATLFLPQNNPLWTIVLSFLCGLALFLKLKHSLHEDNQLVFEPLWLMSGMLVYRVSSFLVNGIALTYGFSSGLFDNQVNVWFWVLPPAFLLGLACHQRIQLRKRRCKTHPTEQRPHLSGDAATSLSPGRTKLSLATYWVRKRTRPATQWELHQERYPPFAHALEKSSIYLRTRILRGLSGTGKSTSTTPQTRRQTIIFLGNVWRLAC